MAKDFLGSASEGVTKALGNKKSPFGVTHKRNSTATIRADTMDKIRYIEIITGKKKVDILDDLINIGLSDEKYRDIVKLADKMKSLNNN